MLKVLIKTKAIKRVALQENTKFLQCLCIAWSVLFENGNGFFKSEIILHNFIKIS